MMKELKIDFWCLALLDLGFMNLSYYDVDDLNQIVTSQSGLSSLAQHIYKLKLFLSLVKTKYEKAESPKTTP